MAQRIEDTLFDEDSDQLLKPNHRIWGALQQSLRGFDEPLEQMLDHLPNRDRSKPTWPSGIDAIDVKAGGFHGFTGIVGMEGIGKSDLAIRSSLLAAHPEQGWHVIYVNGELDRDDIEQRFDRVMSEDYDDYSRCVDQFTVYHADRQTTPQKITDYVLDDWSPGQGEDAERLLIVLDTVDTLAQWRSGPDGQGYLSTLAEYYLWAMGARRLMPKRVAFLVVAESNAEGKGKGKKLEKWADLVLQMKTTKNEHEVALRFTKGRRTGKPDFGTWVHDWQRSRFYYAGAGGRPDLRVVDGGEGEPFGFSD